MRVGQVCDVCIPIECDLLLPPNIFGRIKNTAPKGNGGG